MAQKIVMTILALIALYLILSKGKEFNDILKVGSSTALSGVAVLQGRTAAAAGVK